MRFLILDDDNERQDLFTKWFGEKAYICRCFTAEQAIEELKKEHMPITLIFLDHDLREEHYEAMRQGGEYPPGTGMDVVDFLVTFPQDRRTTPIIVHSLNMPRREEMVRRLQDAAFLVHGVPFGPRLANMANFLDN